MEQTHKFQSTLEILRTMIQLLAVVLMTLGLAKPTFAATDKGSGHFEFVFRLDSDTKAKLPKAETPYKFRTQAASYDEAFKKAAQSCYNHFKGGERLSEEIGLSVIDTCANPRGS
ncbi:MAG: hypothetical protein KF767_10930 [Bdellovibrionaceae bacterium]|nr:hypothetical protein [Pseudobdellovibrionaceae bacterium]